MGLFIRPLCQSICGLEYCTVGSGGGLGKGMWDSCHAFTDQTENLELCSNRLEIVSSLVRAGWAFIIECRRYKYLPIISADTDIN